MQAQNIISPADRLGMTVVLAIGLHVILILGVSFTLRDDATNLAPLSTMEITIIHSQSEEDNADAEFLAQSNQRGGGEAEEKQLPRNPSFNPLTLPQHGEDMRSQNQTIPQNTPTPPESDYLNVDKSPIKLDLIQSDFLITDQLKDLEQDLNKTLMELDSYNAEINQTRSRLAQNKDEKYVSADTREYKLAAYLDTIRARIERIGGINYPDEAKRRNISGNVYIEIVIRADGSLHSVNILRSSGHKILDDAVIRIARFAAPYPPFPEAIKEEGNLVSFKRIWVFESGKVYSGTR